MLDHPYIPPLRPEPERNHWGQYKLPNLKDGKVRGWSRATTIARTLSDEHALTMWKRRMVVQGLAVKTHLLQTVPSMVNNLQSEDEVLVTQAKNDLNKVADAAAQAAGADDGARLGTLLHLITEYADFGRLAEIEHLIPEVLRPDLYAYLATLDGAGIARPTEFIERIVVNSEVDSAGTLDRLVTVNGGPLMVGDLKTQKTMDFGFLEVAVQLAQYAYADALWDEDFRRLVPMPELDKETAIVFHLPVGKARCTLIEVDLVSGWKAALLAHEVREVRRKTKQMGRPLEVETPVSHLLNLVRSAPHVESLTALWSAHRRVWNEELTEAARIRKGELTTELAGLAPA